MVAPVTGPLAKNIADSNSKYRQKLTYKQAKPIDRPLEYFLDDATGQSVFGDINLTGNCSSWFGGFVPNAESSYTNLLNGSYAQLVGNVSDSAQFAVNLAEYTQSMGMMVRRIEQVTAFTRKIIRRDFKGAAEVLGAVATSDKANDGSSKSRQRLPVSDNKRASRFGGRDGNKIPVPSTVRASRSVADNWLEYSFGWKPLLQDIYSAIDHLQTPIKSIRPRGRAWHFHNGVTESGSSATWYITGWSKDSVQLKMFARQGCEVTITNPNLYLANKLGLVNPATVAWELIPFSFVVDWFVNVGSFLSQGTDFLGLGVTNSWRLTGAHGQGMRFRYNRYYATQQNCTRYNLCHFQRKTGLSGVTLKVRPARLWGWQRCGNAAAVLTQLLTKVK